MDALTAIESRSSAAKLAPEAPTRAQIEQVLHAGARAPDHGHLAPWRFVVMQGESRYVLGDAMAEDLRERMPAADADMLAKERAKVERAPVIVAVAAALQEHPKIRKSDQLYAVAAAVQNMFIAAHALGLGAMWKTGNPAWSPRVRAARGRAPTDEIVALFYLGLPLRVGPVRPADIAPVTRWL
jgi:nitroreductase